jgi:hypothetical protein
MEFLSLSEPLSTLSGSASMVSNLSPNDQIFAWRYAPYRLVSEEAAVDSRRPRQHCAKMYVELVLLALLPPKQLDSGRSGRFTRNLPVLCNEAFSIKPSFQATATGRLDVPFVVRDE